MFLWWRWRWLLLFFFYLITLWYYSVQKHKIIECRYFTKIRLLVFNEKIVVFEKAESQNIIRCEKNEFLISDYGVRVSALSVYFRNTYWTSENIFARLKIRVFIQNDFFSLTMPVQSVWIILFELITISTIRVSSCGEFFFFGVSVEWAVETFWRH